MLAVPVLSFLVLTTAVTAAAQPATPPGNPACTVLTSAESASVIGAGGATISVTAAPSGASCMVQNGNKVMTILRVTSASADAAAGLWEAKKRIVSGQDLTGWPTKAYAGSLKDLSAVGLTKAKMFLEVRVIDTSPTKTDLLPKLETVMKAVASRLP